jgi:bifunctional DNA-binding transcriptional regulator/antitoxin component of YhaV-PrlF toxin-antitoxin module
MNCNQNDKSWRLDVQTHENGNAFIEFPSDFLETTGWQEGDTIQWIDRGDGSWEIKKKETEFVLVETVETFRHRYVIEVPVGKSDWALDTVTIAIALKNSENAEELALSEKAKEFSQKHLDETVVSHRVIDRDEVLQLCNEDNDYCQEWKDDLKFETFVTEWKK